MYDFSCVSGPCNKPEQSTTNVNRVCCGVKPLSRDSTYDGDECCMLHDDVIKWKHFLRYWPFVRGIHRSPVNSQHKGQWRRAWMFFFYLRLIKRLSKQSWGWCSETPSRSLWRHCNDVHGLGVMSCIIVVILSVVCRFMWCVYRLRRHRVNDMGIPIKTWDGLTTVSGV